MLEFVQLFRVFVGAPSDVTEELDIIRGRIEEWNRDHGPTTHARVEFTNWRTHSYPGSGKRPQSLLNQQVVDAADIIVALFRDRLGSPTGKAASGTVEEIQRGIRQRKAVMVYFGNLQTPGARRRRDEAGRIDRFRKQLGTAALYHTHTDLQSFESAFRQHLAGVMRDLLKRHPHPRE